MISRSRIQSYAMRLLGGRLGTHNADERRLWIERTLRSLPRGSSILDVGAGEQQYRKYCSHLKYSAHDFAQYDGHGVGTGMQTGRWKYGPLDLVSDITAIPASDGAFDIVMCTEVLEHVADPLAALDELARLVRVGGCLILTAPICSFTHFAPFYFSTGFSRYFYEKHLPERGLSILELTPNGSWFEYVAQEIHRLPAMAAGYSAKRLRLREYVWAAKTLHCLRRLSESDRASCELVGFGYHVLAQKAPTGSID